jgi:hypothetical protein
MIVPARPSFGSIDLGHTVATLPAKELMAFHYPHPDRVGSTVAYASNRSRGGCDSVMTSHGPYVRHREGPTLSRVVRPDERKTSLGH